MKYFTQSTKRAQGELFENTDLGVITNKTHSDTVDLMVLTAGVMFITVLLSFM
ncbi:MAG: hypothetical protein JKY60_19615 [Kordiimonadaceae bacterium]|nr:hypothetical protein [Kordiimonadaceae bacterium]